MVHAVATVVDPLNVQLVALIGGLIAAALAIASPKVVTSCEVAGVPPIEIRSLQSSERS